MIKTTKQMKSYIHMCSWAGLVPRHNESAGKRKTAKTKKGNKYLRSALTEAAHSVRG
ncbi:transposase [Bacillus sp. MUM 116]|uniref:transposase n=1 Tax=Bacillus sp. MUM 116 TaxID=1678002 RepID=UPI003528B023